MKGRRRLLGIALCLWGALGALGVNARAEGTHSHPLCGASHTEIGDHTGECADVAWTAWNGTDAIVYDETTKTAYVYLTGNAERQDAIKVAKGSTLYLCLNGHSIKKTADDKDDNDGVIRIANGGSFSLCDCQGGGTITHGMKDGSTKCIGRGVRVGDGTSGNGSPIFNMYGGEISGNRTGSTDHGQDGGGVYMSSGTFTMYGGKITDNHIQKGSNGYGGGVYTSGGTFTMYGGEISNNTTTDSSSLYHNGGGIYASGSVAIKGGKITGNKAAGDGGGIYATGYSGSVAISGGTISGNTAKSNGGGVYYAGSSSSHNLTVSGEAKIEGNTATENGGGVYFGGESGGDGSKLSVSGGVTITGNKGGCTADTSGDLTGGSDNNVYLASGKTITVTGKLENTTPIGVTTEDAPNDTSYVTIAKASSANSGYADPAKFKYENDPSISVTSIVSDNTVSLVVCKHNWNTEWKPDDSKHWHECGICKGKNDVAQHTYDREIANDAYKASDATCKDPATYYKSCECGKQGTETFTSGEKNSANHSGTLGGGWQSNDNEHWKEYGCCQARADEAEHRWDSGTVTTQATCTVAGERTYTCATCNRKKTEPIDATGHRWANGWAHDATHHWHECENAKCPVTENAGKDGYSQHTGGTATCTAKAACGTCGQSYGDTALHTWQAADCTTPRTCTACQKTEGAELGHDFENGAWQHDETDHWKKCSRCDATDTKNPHTWDTGTVTTQATCTEAGERTYTCATCNRKKTEPIDATGHDLVHHDAKAPTCTEKGWNAYDACSRGDYTTYAEIPASGHDYGTPTYTWSEMDCTAERVCSHDAAHKETERVTATVVVTQRRSCILDELSTYTADFENPNFSPQTKPDVKTAEALGHDFENGAWQHDETNHWKKCSRCDATDTKAPHVYDGGGDTTCDPCGYTRTIAPSGGGGGGSAPAVTVPVTGSRETMAIAISVSGTTAAVKEIRPAELDKIGTDGDVTIDLSGLARTVTEVRLPTDTVGRLAASRAKGVTIELPKAALRMDQQTLDALVAQASGQDIRLVVETDARAEGTMTALQKGALAGMKNAAAIEAYFTSNGERIRDLRGGAVTLSVPYSSDGVVRAWYLREDGVCETVSVSYDRERARLTLRHLSHYVLETADGATAYALCPKDETCPLWAFEDLWPTGWYHDGIHYCLENGLMQGISPEIFRPEGSVTRGQTVTILWRLEGSPEPVGGTDLLDISEETWCAKAVRWAVDTGVVNGYPDGRFGPEDAVLREQMAALLYRYARYKGLDVSAGADGSLSPFVDAWAVSEYAAAAMEWAWSAGVMTGTASNVLAPKDTTTRAQIAMLMVRFHAALAKGA